MQIDYQSLTNEQLATIQKAAEAELQRRYRIETAEADARLKSIHDGIKESAYTPEELRFAAFARCECGAGMAYPKKCGVHGAWECSEILMMKALPGNHPDSKTHSGAMPFSMWEVKSEDQPSAGGATTRPQVEKVEG